MISITAASIASRRHRLLQRTAHDQQNPPPPRQQRRHRSKKVPLVTQTRAVSPWESEPSACPVATEDEYAHAMAARARLHARLHASALLTCPVRDSSPAPVLRESTSTRICSRSPRPQSDAVPSTGGFANVHTRLTTIALSKPQTGLFIDSEIPASTPILDTTKQSDLETDDCSICLDSFSTGKILLCWPCKHRFHYKCLTTWLAAHAQCPNCRAYILKVGFCRASVGFLSTSYSIYFEKNVTPWKVSLRTSPAIN